MRAHLVFAATIALCVPAVLGADRPPNIVVVFTDDQGYGDLGCYGSPNIETPHIDRLAAEGMRFTSFYAAPFCGPSRAALMTGCYPPRVSLAFNHVPNAKTGIHPNETTIAEVLQGAAYATRHLGKWHLGDAPAFLPTRHGFDEYFGLPYSNDMFPYHEMLPVLENEPPLQQAIRDLHGCDSAWIESVQVTETFQGETVWDGVVEVFDLHGHPTASHAYAWSHAVDDSETRRFVVVLHKGLRTRQRPR